jgi:hypothetical protein
VSATLPAVYTADQSIGAGARGNVAARTAQPALAGTLAACLGIAAGRWGSYIGRSPIYLTDVLFLSACIRFLWTRERDASRTAARTSARTGVLVAFVAWAFLRFVLGGRVDLASLRDFTPYAYALAGVLSGAAIVRSTAAARARTARFLTWALAAHAAWFFFVVALWTGLPERLPTLSASEGIHVFTVRADFDMTMVGVYAALLISTALRSSWTWTRIAGIAMCVAAIGVAPSRAGVIGAMTPIAAVLIVAARSVRIPYRARMGLTGVAVILAGALVVSLPLTVPGKRVLGTLGIGSSTHEGTRAVGTTRAREHAWAAVARYSVAQPERLVGGVGFGPNYMVDSGAIYELTTNADTRTRAPHSWWVDVQARLGLIGLILSLLVALKTISRVRVLGERDHDGDNTVYVVASLVTLALIPPMSLGVIMESPFGALPFYWCAGIVLAYEVVRSRSAASRALDASRTGRA